MNKFQLYLDDLWFKFKYLNHKHRPKSPIEVYNTIVVFQFGIENFKYKNGKFKRKK